MICRECKSELPEGTKFCYHCGTPVSGSACPNCGFTMLAPDMKFCPKCGASLGEQTGARGPSRAEGAAMPLKGGSGETPPVENTVAGSKGFFSKFWNGDYSLPKMYWVYGVCLPIAVSICVYAILAVIAQGGHHDNTALVVGIGGILLMVLSVIYLVMWSVGTWRAATKYTGRPIWAILAKIMIVLSCLNFLRGMLQPF